MIRGLALLAASLVLTGCAKSIPLQSTANVTVVQGEDSLPAPRRLDLTAMDRLSLIGPLDKITVEVFGVPELTRQLQVDSGGRISMPLIGTLDAGGKTPAELATSIQSELVGRYVRNPDVTVNIDSSVSQVVTVDGQVSEPGLYAVTNQMTLLRAVASAGGVSEFAKLDDVVVIRTVDGQKLAGLYNLGAIRRGLYDDPAIYPNDVVVVGESSQRRMFRDIVGLAPLLASPVIVLLQNL